MSPTTPEPFVQAERAQRRSDVGIRLSWWSLLASALCVGCPAPVGLPLSIAGMFLCALSLASSKNRVAVSIILMIVQIAWTIAFFLILANLSLASSGPSIFEYFQEMIYGVG